MSNLFKVQWTIIILSGLFLGLSSCEKDDPETETITVIQTDTITITQIDTVYICEDMAAVYIDGECVDTTVVQPLAIGDYYQGGIVFYIDNTGGSGLVCSKNDLGQKEWGCYGDNVGAVGIELGDGNDNTNEIVSNCATANIAANVCFNYQFDGYTDWYLPSLNELNLLHLVLDETNSGIDLIGGDELYGFYWSSSEASDYEAWYISFFSGDQSTVWKNNSRDTRAIRSF